MELKQADHPLRRGKILFVIGQLHVGGAEKHLVSVARALKERGWEPEIFCLSDEGPLAAEARAGGVPVYASTLFGRPVQGLSHWFLRVLGAGASLFSHLLFRRPRLIHFFLPDAYVFGGFCALALGIRPRIMSRRSLNNYQKMRDPWLAEAERFLHPRMTLICGNSLAVNKQLTDEGAPEDRLRIIYSGVDSGRFSGLPSKQAAREVLNIEPAALVLVMVANIIPYKGHGVLLNALGEIRHHLPMGWRMMMAGRDDGIGADLRTQAESLGIAGNIVWLGQRNDVPALLRAADIGVHCSLEEGFANAILEGMAAGLPMVVSDVGGNPEAVEHGKSGLVVPVNDSAALGAALADLARAPGRREAMGCAALERASSLFSMEKCVSDYERMYAEALALEKAPERLLAS